jgi:hypothetical protein
MNEMLRKAFRDSAMGEHRLSNAILDLNIG